MSIKYDEIYHITPSGMPWKILVIRMNVVLTVPAAISLLSIISHGIGELLAIRDCTYIYIYINIYIETYIHMSNKTHMSACICI